MKARFEEIKRHWADLYGFTVDDVEGKGRKAPLPEVRARIIFQYKNEYPNAAWRSMAEWLGGFDHSSIIHLYNQMTYGAYGEVKTMPCNHPSINFSYTGTFNYQLI